MGAIDVRNSANSIANISGTDEYNIDKLYQLQSVPRSTTKCSEL